jgi:hypothetical protein
MNFYSILKRSLALIFEDDFQILLCKRMNDYLNFQRAYATRRPEVLFRFDEESPTEGNVPVGFFPTG